ncbi:hypothetical protein L210DRAFT_3609909 [Boletus edulis BED1]|uniref:DUF7598 domain-containing protein n=1 Tax=Boletus edulis BED1 TaxID=1328754 RepID=A0AAD4C4P3_BOLED|nr:hypothetical protein L210DRAFT_3609909 [Boletus edulis BED1]
MAPIRTYIFFTLNAVRVLSIVSLLLVFASSILVIVNDVEAVNEYDSAKQSSNATSEAFADCEYILNSTVPNQIGGVFWAVINRLFIIFQVITLILSELGWPAAFFDRFFPVLGTQFGLGALGIFQGLIGASVLSQHVDDFTLVAAFFLFIIGCINMLLGLIFRESVKERRSITAWRAGPQNTLPTHLPPAAHLNRAGTSSSGRSFASSTVSASRAGYGFGRQGEKAAGMKGFLISKPLETLPRYAARPTSPPSVAPRSQSPVSEPHFRSSTTAV